MKFVRNIVYALPISDALHEMILEGLRLAFLSAISAIVTFAIEQVKLLPNAEIWTAALTIVLRMIDKWKYINGETTIKRGGYNGGLTGF